MSLEHIKQVITELEAEGRRATVRAVYAVVGGNFNTVQKLMKQVKGGSTQDAPTPAGPSSSSLATLLAAELGEEPESIDPNSVETWQRAWVKERNQVEELKERIEELEAHEARWLDASTLTVSLNQGLTYLEGSTRVTPPRGALTVYFESPQFPLHTKDWKEWDHTSQYVMNFLALSDLENFINNHSDLKHQEGLKQHIRALRKLPKK